MTIKADHLDNSEFNYITKSSLLVSMCIINQEKTPLQMDVTASMLSFSLYGIIYFAIFLLFGDCF